MTTHRRKLFIWFITLTLILACAPSLPTPVPLPTTDPNSINIFIAQTANAASTQTVAAIPTFTLTATSTATPRNTFTPEPSVTPFQTFILPSPTPIIRIQYFRVKHDSQLALYNFKSRTADKNWAGRDQTPEVVPLFGSPSPAASTNRTRLVGTWETLINSLNNYDEDKLRYLKAPHTGLFNTSGFPQLESLTMGGNIILLDEIRGKWGRVHTLDYNNPPDLVGVTYTTRPDLIHKFVVVGWRQDSKTTIIVNTPQGSLYWPLVTEKPVWIEMSRLEKFPSLPMTVTVNTTVYIQKTPGPDNEPTESHLDEGETARVVDYFPSGPNVWGRVQGGGWIALLWHTQYTTSWQMETVPPP
ncbi:MAG: hypothetical protein L0Z71_09745 [Anaerolineae bacterium]|nr:hypothetical protein [Anaerolineae bacterium]